MKDMQTFESDINKTYREMISAAHTATKKGMYLGYLLADARLQFENDTKFGEWRSQNTPVSADMASRLMQISKEFANHPKAMKVPISTLREMLPLSSDKKQELLDRVIPPTVKEVRAIKKGDVSPGDAAVPAMGAAMPVPEGRDDTSGALSGDAEGPPPYADTATRAIAVAAAATRLEKMEARKQNVNGSMVERAQAGMMKIWQDRFKEFDGGGDEALRAFGLCEFEEYLPNPNVIRILYGYYSNGFIEGDMEAIIGLNIDNAYEEILAIYEDQDKTKEE